MPFCIASNSSKTLCKNKECKVCFEKSLASHPQAQYWNKDLNGDITPREIRRGNQKKFWFDCNVCKHTFNAKPNHITNGSWCPYCAHLKLCDNEDCEMCFENSAASTSKAKLWNYELNNGLTPRNVFKFSTLKYWFTCNRCQHDFFNIHTYLCPFCSHDKLCPKENECETCFEKSFASNPKSRFWNQKLNGDITPRDVYKNSNKKFWFTCQDCGWNFQTNLLNVTTGNNWCGNPIHKNKTEAMVLEFLQATFDVIYQARFDWCRSGKTNYHLPFDFCLPNKKIIIEVDGKQHIQQVRDWAAPEERQKIDIYKMKLAIDQGYRIIRIFQEDVKNNKLSWKEDLTKYIEDGDIIEYICRNNEYDVYKDQFQLD